MLESDNYIEGKIKWSKSYSECEYWLELHISNWVLLVGFIETVIFDQRLEGNDIEVCGDLRGITKALKKEYVCWMCWKADQCNLSRVSEGENGKTSSQRGKEERVHIRPCRQS